MDLVQLTAYHHPVTQLRGHTSLLSLHPWDHLHVGLLNSLQPDVMITLYSKHLYNTH